MKDETLKTPGCVHCGGETRISGVGPLGKLLVSHFWIVCLSCRETGPTRPTRSRAIAAYGKHTRKIIKDLRCNLDLVSAENAAFLKEYREQYADKVNPGAALLAFKDYLRSLGPDKMFSRYMMLDAMFEIEKKHIIPPKSKQG